MLSLMKEKGAKAQSKKEKKIIRFLCIMHPYIFPLYVYDYVFAMIRMHAKKVSTSIIYIFENLIIELHACSVTSSLV